MAKILMEDIEKHYKSEFWKILNFVYNAYCVRNVGPFKSLLIDNCSSYVNTAYVHYYWRLHMYYICTTYVLHMYMYISSQLSKISETSKYKFIDNSLYTNYLSIIHEYEAVASDLY